MKMNEAEDPILDLLAALSPAAPPRRSDERIRARCQRVLARRRPVPRRRSRSMTAMGSLFNTTLALAAAIYGAAAVVEGLRLLIPNP